MFRDGGGEQCRGACSEVLLEEIKEAAPRRVRDGGVVIAMTQAPGLHNFYVFPIVARLRDMKKRAL